MKNVFILVFSFFSLIGFAQDQLIFKNGEDLQVKVVEITPDQIKYKRFNHLDGPTIVIHKEDVLLIQYENGTKDLFYQQQTLDQPTQPNKPIHHKYADTPKAPKQKSDIYLQDDMLFFSGIATTLEGSDAKLGFQLGLERAYYFHRNFALTAHVSGTYNALENGYYSGGMIQAFFLGGIQARTRTIGNQLYGQLLVGTAWTTYTGDFNELDNIWAPTIGLGAGVVINDFTDIGLRFTYDPDNEFSYLQIGVGIHF
ncbi:MAG: hypothetical protein R2828_29675 [Saprospiraceae bacterium]